MSNYLLHLFVLCFMPNYTVKTYESMLAVQVTP